jgi:Pyruvate/2-oxoacid:ferredoxin oxidoreductase delta subunit/flavodoxin
MNSIIFCYSGTGNSLNVAVELDKKLKNNNILTMREKNELQSVERIGFIFPVYAYGMPRTVEEFIKKSQFNKNTYYYAVVTCGGTPGNTLYKLDQLLKEKGCKLSAGFTLKEKNHNLLDTNLFMKIMIKIAGKQPVSFMDKKDKILNIVINEKKHKLETSSWFANKIGDIIHNKALEQLRENYNNFYTNDKCNGCNTCLNICPKNNIGMKSNKPIWYDDCESCFACLQWCPQRAIEYKDFEREIERSHNKNISKDEMFKYFGPNKNKERIE